MEALCAALALTLSTVTLAPAPAAPAAPVPRAASALNDDLVLVRRVLQPDTGDLDARLAGEGLRVLVPYSRTHFFVSRGRPRGATVDAFREFQKTLAKRVGEDAPVPRVVLIPVEFDQLITFLEAGFGDVAAGALTVTPDRARRVAFSSPLATGVRELVVAGPGVRPPRSLDDLAGRRVHVTRASSYAEHLADENAELRRRGLAPIDIVEVDHRLVTEDVLELVHAGVFELTVADDYLVDLWSPTLEGLRTTDLAVHEAGEIAWAVRRDAPEVLAALDRFARTSRAGTLLGNVLIHRWFEDASALRDPTRPEERARLDGYAAIVQRYAREYDFDWLLIAAQAYQESGFDAQAHSHSGARGLMQLLPSTFEWLGFDDPDDVEQNLHAGIKYMALLRDGISGNPTTGARIDLALASYNAGPGRVRRWRRAAREHGLDPDVWFGSVERIALEDVGPETSRYVGNIDRYYLAYRLAQARNEGREAARAAEAGAAR